MWKAAALCVIDLMAELASSDLTLRFPNPGAYSSLVRGPDANGWYDLEHFNSRAAGGISQRDDAAGPTCGELLLCER
jgi:hypothetical protein